MNEQNRNSITYDENWQSVSESEYAQVVSNQSRNPSEEDFESSAQENNKSPQGKKPNTFLLLTIQLIVCLAIALTAFIIKNIGGKLYDDAHSLYQKAVNSSAIFDDNGEFDLSGLFSDSTPDEV